MLLPLLLLVLSTLFDRSAAYITSWGKNNYVVSLVLAENKVHFCSGTLISPRIVVTAATCLVHHPDAKPGNIQVVLSGRIFDKISVSQIVIHSQFDPALRINDIALIHLSLMGVVNVIQNKWLKSDVVRINETVYAMEFANDTINRRDLVTVDSEDAVCSSNFHFICAANYDPTELCWSDFGGPLLNERKKIVGVIPYRENDVYCLVGLARHYIRIEAYKFWINEEIGKLSLFKKRSGVSV